MPKRVFLLPIVALCLLFSLKLGREIGRQLLNKNKTAAAEDLKIPLKNSLLRSDRNDLSDKETAVEKFKKDSHFSDSDKNIVSFLLKLKRLGLQSTSHVDRQKLKHFYLSLLEEKRSWLIHRQVLRNIWLQQIPLSEIESTQIKAKIDSRAIASFAQSEEQILQAVLTESAE